jgi:hypothetical protein
MEKLKPEHISGLWRLFVDLSKVCLRAVLFPMEINPLLSHWLMEAT